MTCTEAGTSIRTLFKERNYRLLFAGQGIALLGEQMNLIALPWLALQMTGDPLALGSVLAIGGIPPAVLMLFGGATTDRLSPRTLMLVVDAVRFAAVVALIALVLTHSVALWLLYPLSLGFGLLSAFSMPAASSITRTLLADRDLQSGNSFFQSLTVLAGIIGPAVAGFLLVVGGNAAAFAPGLALAFGIYALGLAISVATLWAMHVPSLDASSVGRARSNILHEMGAAVQFAWREPMLRILFVMLLVLNLLLAGPFGVGVPVVCQTRLVEGAAAYGLLTSAFAGGSLVGYLAAGFYRRSKRIGLLLVATLALFGVGMYALSWVQDLGIALIVPLLLGAGNGYIGVILRTLLQQTTPRDMIGRIMSLYLFGRAALVPVSQMASGALILRSLDALFWGAGALLILLAAVVAVSPVPRWFETQVQVRPVPSH